MKMGMLEKVPMNVANPLSPGIRHVIDGGSLLHRIRWPMKVITYGQLVDMYVQYVDRQYGPNSQVIFDGYPENTPTAKDEGHMRREGKTTAPNISVDKAIIVNDLQMLASLLLRRKKMQIGSLPKALLNQLKTSSQ